MTALISAVTPCEMGIKRSSGLWPEAGRILERWDSLIDEAGYRPLPITSRHAIHAAALNWPHRAPFDRIRAAQARLDSAGLITPDAWMLAILPDALHATPG